MLAPNYLTNLRRVARNRRFGLKEVGTKLSIAYASTVISYKEKDESGTPGKIKFKIYKIYRQEIIKKIPQNSEQVSCQGREMLHNDMIYIHREGKDLFLNVCFSNRNSRKTR